MVETKTKQLQTTLQTTPRSLIKPHRKNRTLLREPTQTPKNIQAQKTKNKIGKNLLTREKSIPQEKVKIAEEKSGKGIPEVPEEQRKGHGFSESTRS